MHMHMHMHMSMHMHMQSWGWRTEFSAGTSYRRVEIWQVGAGDAPLSKGSKRRGLTLAARHHAAGGGGGSISSKPASRRRGSRERGGGESGGPWGCGVSGSAHTDCELSLTTTEAFCSCSI